MNKPKGVEPVKPVEHDAIRQQDQMSCVKCGKCWDVDDDDVPPCTTGSNENES
jgi:hypothetical protein